MNQVIIKNMLKHFATFIVIGILYTILFGIELFLQNVYVLSFAFWSIVYQLSILGLVIYHVVISVVLLKKDNMKASKVLWLILAFFAPWVAAHLSIGILSIYFVSTYGFANIGWHLPGFLRLLPALITGIGVVVWIVETLFTDWPTPCIDLKWFKISGLRLIVAGFGLEAGIWVATLF